VPLRTDHVTSLLVASSGNKFAFNCNVPLCVDMLVKAVVLVIDTPVTAIESSVFGLHAIKENNSPIERMNVKIFNPVCLFNTFIVILLHGHP
jgi:hypothetical protein